MSTIFVQRHAGPSSRRETDLMYQVRVKLLVDDRWRPAGRTPGVSATWCDDAGETPSLVMESVTGEPIAVRRLRATVSVPLLNYASVVIPDCGRHYIDSMKALDIRAERFRVTAANAGHPFFALADELGAFYFAFGVLNAPGEVEIRRMLPVIGKRRAMVGGDERLALAFEWVAPGAMARISVDLFAVTDRLTWFEALRDFTAHVRQRENIVYPKHDAAWDPVWCTWTAFPSATMTGERVLENARRARDLGVRTVILDDGWFGPGLDDDGSGPITHGDYAPDVAKFPDLCGTIDALHAMDIRCLLWHAPLCVAPTSEVFERMNRLLIRQEGEPYVSPNGLAQLCPQCPQVRDYVADETQRLLEAYGADGLKVDLFNCLPDMHCDCADHDHDFTDPLLALDALMAAVWARAKAVNPDVLIELKQDYGNVRLIRHGTMVRAGDTAYDMDSNVQRCAYTQAFAPCVHVDPLVTSVHTKPAAMAVMMIKALAAGVPTFSMDLVKLPKALREVIGAWLAFYNEHRPMWMPPRSPQELSMDVWQGGTREQAWVAALGQAQHVCLPEAGEVWVLNGTGRGALTLSYEDVPAARWTVYDMLHRPIRSGTDRSRCMDVPVGGLIHFVRKG